MKLPFILGIAMFTVAAGAGETDPAVAPSDVDTPSGQEADPFAPAFGGSSEVRAIPEARLSESRDTLRLRLEIWEMDTVAFVGALDELETQGDVGEFRRRLRQREGSRLVHAPMLVLEARSGKSVEGRIEEIYPTEYEPPEVLPGPAVEKILDEKTPETLGEVIQQLTTPAIGTAFETRSTGVTMEALAQPVEISGEERWDVSLSFEKVELLDQVFHGPKELNIIMPVFGCYRCGGLQRVVTSRWHFVSAAAPATREEGRTWVAMMRVDRER